MIFYQIGNRLFGTQADARALSKDFEQIDIPTDKAGLMAFVQGLLDKVGQQAEAEHRRPPVAVTLEHGDEIKVLGRFETVEDAEHFLATSATIDPELLEGGFYSVDAPEELINPTPPPVPSYTERSVEIDEVFENLPLAHQLHLAALAMENARKRIAISNGISTTVSNG